jgi:hypothetical protein
MALALSAAKCIPMVASLQESPRHVVTEFSYSFVNLVRRLIAPTGGKNIPDTYYYIGKVACIAAFVPLLTGSARARAFWLGAALFTILATGHFSAWSPCALLEKLPVFGQLRYPFRYLMVTALFLALSAGLAVTQLEESPVKLARWWNTRRQRRGPPRRATIEVLGLLGSILGLVAALAVGWTVIKDTRITKGRVYRMRGPDRGDLEFRQARGNRWDAQIWPFLNIGSLVCITGAPVKQSGALRPDLEAEEYPLDPSLASVRRISWSPNRIDLAVHARKRTLVLVNQNHHRGWSSSVGRVIDHEGLLAVEVPEGKHRVTLAYTTPMWVPCLTVSLLALLGLLVVMVLAIRQQVTRLVESWRTLAFWPGDSRDGG